MSPVTVLVTTFGPRAEGLIESLPQVAGVRWVISHQLGGSRRLPPFTRPDVTYHAINTTGVSANRNALLAFSPPGIALMSDDDVEYLPGFAETISSGFERHPDADFLTFVVVDENDQPRRRELTGDLRHTTGTVWGVSSVEIALRVDSVRRLGIRFRENIGIGTPLGLGEEPIFLRDLVRAGAVGYRIEVPICRVGGSSSGQRMNQRLDPADLCRIGALIYAEHGWRRGAREIRRFARDESRGGKGLRVRLTRTSLGALGMLWGRGMRLRRPPR